MKTVKLKASNSITLAHAGAALGQTPSGAIIFEVTEVPDNVSHAQVRLKYSNYAGVWVGRLSVKWSD